MSTKKSRKAAPKRTESGTITSRFSYKERLAIMKRVEAGETQTAIAADVGVSRAYISLLWQDYLAKGEEGVRPKPAGRKRLRRLSEAEQTKIRKLLDKHKRPSDAGIKTRAREDFWNQPSVLALIERELQFTPGKTELAQLLLRWRITKPRLASAEEVEFDPDYYRYINSEIGKKVARREAKLREQWENEAPDPAGDDEDEDIDYADLAAVRKELRRSAAGTIPMSTSIANQRSGKHKKNRASPKRKKAKKGKRGKGRK